MSEATTQERLDAALGVLRQIEQWALDADFAGWSGGMQEQGDRNPARALGLIAGTASIGAVLAAGHVPAAWCHDLAKRRGMA